MFTKETITPQSLNNIYENITHLSFQGSADLHYTTLPLLNKCTTLTDLIMPNHFNLSIDDLLPENLQKLSLGTYFNQSVDHLPQKLKELTLGIWSNYYKAAFNQSVDFLPAALTHITFGELFDQPIDYLPSSLCMLKVGFNFNNNVDHLPPTFDTFDFGNLVLQTRGLSTNVSRSIGNTELCSQQDLKSHVIGVSLKIHLLSLLIIMLDSIHVCSRHQTPSVYLLFRNTSSSHILPQSSWRIFPLNIFFQLCFLIPLPY